MTRSALYTIPAYRPFLDTLVAGLMAEHGGDPLGLAEIVILLPNRRAQRSEKLCEFQVKKPTRRIAPTSNNEPSTRQ